MEAKKIEDAFKIILEEYKHGVPIKELMTKYNRSGSRIRMILRNGGIKLDETKSKAGIKGNIGRKKKYNKVERSLMVKKSYTPELKKVKKQRAIEQWQKNVNNLEIKKQAINSTNINKYRRKEVLNEHSNKCDKCGSSNSLIIHHDEYLYTDNNNHLSVLCTRCHAKLHKELRRCEDRFRGDYKIKRAILDILKALNIDASDENFRNTPSRISRMFHEMCEGLNAKDEIKEILRTKFPSTYEGMVISSNIEVWSLCPHHLLPVKYVINVGILFNKECIGLSKIPRLVELLSKKPVLQETLTQEITEIIDTHLQTLGSICIIEGMHTCMQARGVKANGTKVTTSSCTGKFLNPDKHKNPKEEFLSLIKLEANT